MAADPINSYDATEPKSTTKVKNGPTVIPANWDSVENMVSGTAMQGLEITQTAGKTATIDYTRLGLVLNSATPPLVFCDISPTQIAMDWDNGVGMNGRETGLATTVGWKYIWVYRDDTNGVTSGLWSAATAIGSVAEPDADFRFGRLVGAGYWDGASAFTAFIQRQNRVTLKTLADQAILTDGRSDGTWASVSLSAVVPSLTTMIKGFSSMTTNNAVAGDTWFQTAADTSGNYTGAQIRGSVESTFEIGGAWEQELTSQAVAYYTSEAQGLILLDLWLTSYWLDI